MATPEGKIKDAVKKVFKRFGTDLYHHMPVQNGMGRPTLDFTGAIRGRAFAVETKAPGKKPTERQIHTINEMEAAGMKVFVVDDTKGPTIEALEGWLLGVTVMLAKQPIPEPANILGTPTDLSPRHLEQAIEQIEIAKNA